MSLAPKDLRPKVDHRLHEALDRLATLDGLQLNEFCGRILSEYVSGRAHKAIETIQAVGDLGFAGNQGEFPGISGKRAR